MQNSKFELSGCSAAVTLFLWGLKRFKEFNEADKNTNFPNLSIFSKFPNFQIAQPKIILNFAF